MKPNINVLFICWLFHVAFNVSHAQYDSLSRVHYQTYAEYSVNYKRGLINTVTADTLLPAKYRQIDIFSEGLARVYLNNSIGYMDTSGQFIIPLGTYQSPGGGSERGMFSCGLAVVQKEGLYGAINKKGQVIIPFKSRQLVNFTDQTAITFEQKKYGLLNTENEILFELEYDQLWKYKSFIYLKKDNKMAFADLAGDLKCKFEFDKVAPNRYGGVILTKNEQDGYANPAGIQIINCAFDHILWYNPLGKTTWVMDKEFLSILDSNLSPLASIANGAVIHPSSPNNPTAIHSADSIQYFDSNGILVGTTYQYLKQKHASAYRFKNDKCIVAKNDKWGMIDANGRVLIPFDYDWLMPPSSLNYLIAKKGNLNGMVDSNNRIILNFKERSINHLNYAGIEALQQVIDAEKWAERVASKIKISRQEAVKKAMRKNMYYQSESAAADVCKLITENEEIVWEIVTYKSGYTDKGDCAKTNGCSIVYKKQIKINAVTGKVVAKNSSKSLYPNYE
ncbi:hypothetical protein DNU06_04445 [Putridiphycobacter roseus]|uniref:WG repeat-containing protein n=1 Tax=Putridiphycobacter roseus TaxID=2219161 RepID=A0A2W1NFJ3_9FLAO|nr:WG repeat-containing protein [Putridiphycobacter roseus]PZE17873.1 hypothetical protein DNU06_04445 [Putridiphycobacter roseus]